LTALSPVVGYDKASTIAQMVVAQMAVAQMAVAHMANDEGLSLKEIAQLGDYANLGQNIISVVDADSFWIDGYFEETNLGSIREGDPAKIKLMGYSQIARGHVASIARGINVANAQSNSQGVATVNPIFTWVRLAQRIPVRIAIDQLREGAVLALE
jgi:multidrug resistance efflux pump